jgi:hypothetical protein
MMTGLLGAALYGIHSFLFRDPKRAELEAMAKEAAELQGAERHWRRMRDARAFLSSSQDFEGLSDEERTVAFYEHLRVSYAGEAKVLLLQAEHLKKEIAEAEAEAKAKGKKGSVSWMAMPTAAEEESEPAVAEDLPPSASQEAPASAPATPVAEEPPVGPRFRHDGTGEFLGRVDGAQGDPTDKSRRDAYAVDDSVFFVYEDARRSLTLARGDRTAGPVYQRAFDLLDARARSAGGRPAIASILKIYAAQSHNNYAERSAACAKAVQEIADIIFHATGVQI